MRCKRRTGSSRPPRTSSSPPPTARSSAGSTSRPCTGVLLAAAAAGIVWRFLPATTVQVDDFDEVDGPATLPDIDDEVEEPFVHGTPVLATE